MQRRNFLKLAGSVLLPGVGFSMPRTDTPVLILLELNGGNDSLNTIIPFNNKIYYQQRPTLAVAKHRVIKLNKQLGFNPALEALLPLWKNNQLAVINGLGYEQPNRSHFRSIDIWETASDSNEFLEYGWFAQAVKANIQPPSRRLADGLVLRRGEGPLRGRWMKNITLKNPKQVSTKRPGMNTYTDTRNTSNNPALKHIIDTYQTVDDFSRAIKSKLGAMPRLTTKFPKTAIGRQFQMAARIIQNDIPIRAIKVSHGSFDTHANQKARHDSLLKQLAQAIAAFNKEMTGTGYWDKIIIMTYSEFGRRVAENGSRGTDHGTAASHFVMGGKVNGGFYGQYPSLSQLDNGDLIHTTDYRRMYHSILKAGLGFTHIPPSVKPFTVLPGLFS